MPKPKNDEITRLSADATTVVPTLCPTKAFTLDKISRCFSFETIPQGLYCGYIRFVAILTKRLLAMVKTGFTMM